MLYVNIFKLSMAVRQGGELDRETKIELGVFLIAVAFSVIAFQVRSYLDREFERLVPRSGKGGVATAGPLGGIFNEVMEGDPVEKRKQNVDKLRNADKKENKKQREIAEAKRGIIVPKDNLIPGSLAQIQAEDGQSSVDDGLYPEDARGLHAEYFGTMNFKESRLVRLDDTIDFDWGGGSPADEVEKDKFSVRWTGWIVPAESGKHRFCGYTDDGFQLYIGDSLVAEFWKDRAPGSTLGTIELEAGKRYPFKFRYYENGGGAVAKLYWAYGEKLKEIEGSEKKTEEDKKKD